MNSLSCFYTLKTLPIFINTLYALENPEVKKNMVQPLAIVLFSIANIF